MSRLLSRFYVSCMLVVAVIVASALANSGYAQDDGNQGEVRINDIRADFPRIEVVASVVRQGRAVAGLSASDFLIGEPHRDLTVEEIGASSTLAVVIDTPNQLLGVELERVKEAVRLYFNDPNLYEDGSTVIIVHQINENYTPRTFNNRSDILAFINGLPNGSGFNRYESGLQSAADELTRFLDESGGTGNILIVGAFPQRDVVDLTSTAALAQALSQERGFTISVIQAFTGSRQRFSASYQVIANQGGGQFAAFGPSANASVLNAVYEQIQGEQSAYRLTYESLDGASGVHTVSLTATVDGAAVSGTFDYIGPNLIAPIVTLQGVVNNETITRIQDPTTGQFDTASREIQVDVTFPDGFERDLSEVLLEVTSNGQVIDEVSINPDSSTNIRLAWDLADFVPPAGSSRFNQSFTLIIRAIDQYSLVGQSSPLNVIVQAEATVVAAPTLAPTSDTSIAVTQTAIALQATVDAALALALSPEDIQATATAIAAANLTAAEVAVEDDGGIPIFVPIVGGAVIFLLIFLILGAVLGRGGNQQPAPIAAPAHNLDIMKTQVGFAATPPAILEVLTGIESGQQVQIDAASFTIGRTPAQGIHYATPAYDNVSSRHCTIIKRNNDYLIVDHGSTNGTFVNGSKLTPNIETPLPPNATIQLGKDPSSSIQMRLSIPSGGGLGDIGKTRIDIGGAAPVDNAVWGQKTQLYGQQNQQPAPPPVHHLRRRPPVNSSTPDNLSALLPHRRRRPNKAVASNVAMKVIGQGAARMTHGSINNTYLQHKIG